MILKNLLRRKARTALTVLGISVGVAAIVALGAMASALKAGYDSMLTGSKADLILSQPNAFDPSLSSVDETIGDDLAAMPEVKAVSSMLQGIVQAENSPYFYIFGYPEDSFILNRYPVIEGVGFADRQAQSLRGKPVILGSAAAKALKKAPGDTLQISGSAFRVIGIYQAGDAFEDGGAILRLQDAQELLGKAREVSLFYIQLKDLNLRERLTDRVERQWKDLAISGTSDYANNQAFNETMAAYVWVIAGLAIILGGVGMMNAQLMAVFERTREIGVLRAVGWSSRQVMVMILEETLLVSMAGGVIGVILGWLALSAVSSFTVIFGASTSSITPALIGQAFIVVIILGLVGGLYPAWRASRLQPVEALRYEGGSSGENVRRLPFGGMALQSLWQRTTRTALTLGVIGLTVGAIMALEAVLGGAAQSLTQMAFGSDAQILIRQADISDTSYSAIDEQIGKRIAAMPEVTSVSGIIFTAILLPDTGGFFIIQGYSPQEYAIHTFHIVSGETLTQNHQIILGKMMAETMHKEAGDTVVLNGIRYRVVGIYESNVGWEEMGGVMTMRDAQAFIGRPRKVTMYAVRLKNPGQAPALVERINQEMPEAHAALSGEFVDQMPDMQNSYGMMAGISFLAIVVGGLGVMNTMLMAVFERTREIGVLRAVGWRRRAILRQILQESLVLALLGGVAGIIIAFGLVFLMGMAPMVGEAFRPVWSAGVFIRALLVAVSLGLFGGVYPAYRATRLQPVEALRYE